LSPGVNLASEDLVILECARTELTVAGRARTEVLLAEALDWDYILEASIRHGVAPLVHRALDELGASGGQAAVPVEFAAELQRLYEHNGLRNERLYGVLRDILRTFGSAGVEALGLKDVQLVPEVYRDPALRPMGDIDLLVRREDYESAASCLGSLGFSPLPSADAPFARRYAFAQHFRRDADDVWVDLQWNVLELEWDVYGEGCFTYDARQMWDHAELISFEGCELLVPSPEQMLFHLCLHLEGHRYAELILFTDVAELLRTYEAELEWDTFVSLVHAYGAESSVWHVLHMTQRLLGAVLPAELEELRPPYFRGQLVLPIFKNLTSLHHSLDEIRLAARPPQTLLDELEGVVRTQAARARRLFSEVDTFASAFVGSGGKLIFFDGRRSERLFPDASVPAFEDLHAFVLADDSLVLRKTLLGCGFDLDEAAGRRVASKRCNITSRDPAIPGGETSLLLRVELGQNIRLGPGAHGARMIPNKVAAIRSLRARLGQGASDDREATVRVQVHELSPEELVVALAAQLAASAHDRLFEACSLLEVFRLDVDVDWDVVWQTAYRLAVEDSVGAGLRLAVGLLGEDARIAPLPTLETQSARPMLLRWARNGPGAEARYPVLRKAYFFAFCLLALRGPKARANYLRSAFVGNSGAPPVVPRLLLELFLGAFRSVRTPRRRLRDLAYWVE
jgi:hypothetical protein